MFSAATVFMELELKRKVQVVWHRRHFVGDEPNIYAVTYAESV